MPRRFIWAVSPLLIACASVPSAVRDNNWVESTLAGLSLREKVGQLIMPQLKGDYTPIDSPEFDRLLQLVETEKVGGFVISIGMPLSYAAKLNALQERARVPLLIASDMENGPGMRMAGIYSFPHLLPQGGGTNFPPAMALGAAGSDSLAYALARVLATEARAVGVNMTFGPVVDVNSNPANPIINTRSFGEDPAQVGRLAAAYVRGAREGGLLTTAKHFPGHGDTDVDSHLDLPSIRADRARLDAVELAPYRSIVPDVDGVMTAHIAMQGVEGSDAPPATLSTRFLTDVLRKELGFSGIIISDAMDMGAIVRRYGITEPIVRTIEAGADLILMPVDVHAAVEALVSAVESGRLPSARIDASVRRVLQAKQRAGLPQRRLVDLTAVSRAVGVRSHVDVARRIAEGSITLARDDQRLVPLNASVRRVLIVTYAEANDPVAGSIFLDEMRRRVANVTQVRVDARTTPAEYTRLKQQADSADLVLVAAHATPMEGTGSIGVRGGVTTFVDDLIRQQRRVLLLSFGSPYLITDFPNVTSYLLAWGGAEVSQQAAVRALFGEIPIRGKLPVSIPPHYKRGAGIARAASDE
jgi:beta-N-acetylhexosaminidase